MSSNGEKLDLHGSDVEAPSPSGDADLYIDPVAEKKLLRKLDSFIAPMCIMFFLVAYLDRSNIGNAAIAGMTEDLGLTGNNLNVAVTVFYGTLNFSLPSFLDMTPVENKESMNKTTTYNMPQ